MDRAQNKISWIFKAGPAAHEIPKSAAHAASLWKKPPRRDFFERLCPSPKSFFPKKQKAVCGLLSAAAVFGGLMDAAGAESRHISFERSPMETRYLAITAGEVKKIVGMYQSENNEKAAARIIMKRAANVCASLPGHELLDFEIESASHRGRYALVDDFGKTKSLAMDSKISGGMVALNIGSAGLAGLFALAARASWRGISLAIGTDLGISYGADLALRALQDLDLKGWLSYHYAYFKKITCLNKEGLEEHDVGQSKLSYFCPKLFRGRLCGRFESIGHFQCFLAAREKRLGSRDSIIARCKAIASDGQAGCVGAALEKRYKLRYAANHCAKIESAAQGIAAIGIIENSYKLKYAVEQALRIEEPFQAKAAVKAMDQWKPKYAVEQALRIQTPFQANAAVKAMDRYNPRAAVREALRIETAFQAEAAVKAMNQWRPDPAVEQALRLQTPFQADVAVKAMNQYNPRAAVREALRIETAFQAEAAVKAMNQWRPAHAVEQALRIEAPFQAEVALKAMDQYNPRAAVREALRIKTPAQAEAAVRGMDQWRPVYAVGQALAPSQKEAAAQTKGKKHLFVTDPFVKDLAGYALKFSLDLADDLDPLENFAETAEERCGADNKCRQKCHAIFQETEDDCSSLIIGRAHALFRAHDALQAPNEENLKQIKIEDLGLLALIDTDLAKNIFEQYTYKEAKIVYIWLQKKLP